MLKAKTKLMLEGYSFLLPWLIGLGALVIYPLIMTVRYSVSGVEVGAHGLDLSWNDWANYLAAWKEPRVLQDGIYGTLWYVGEKVPLIIIFSLFSAIVLNRAFRLRGLFRALFFLPVIFLSSATWMTLNQVHATSLPMFQSGTLFEMMYRYLPGNIAIPLINWAATSLSPVIWSSGIQTTMFLAGLQGISGSLYEAAKCDGATGWESFWKITFPMISPIIMLNIIYSIADSFTGAFSFFAPYIRDEGIGKANFGYAAAVGWVDFTLTMGIFGMVFLVTRKLVYYSGVR